MSKESEKERHEMFINFFHLALDTYFRHESNDSFEADMMKQSDKNDFFTKDEFKKMINHFRKEIYPLDTDTIVYLKSNLKKGNIHYVKTVKKIKKVNI